MSLWVSEGPIVRDEDGERVNVSRPFRAGYARWEEAAEAIEYWRDHLGMAERARGTALAAAWLARCEREYAWAREAFDRFYAQGKVPR